MIRMECVLCQVGTEVVLTNQINFIFQRATVGCKIVPSLKKGDKSIWNSEREKTGSNPARSKIFSSVSKRAETVLGPNQPPVQWVPGFFPGVNRPWPEFNHSLPLIPRLRRCGAVPLLSLYALTS